MLSANDCTVFGHFLQTDGQEVFMIRPKKNSAFACVFELNVILLHREIVMVMTVIAMTILK